MRVAVMTATKRFGGIDVSLSGLRNQTHKDFVWIVADELYYDRRYVMGEVKADFEISHMNPPPKPKGYYSNLPAIYNAMIERAIALDCDLAISLQDYVWIKEDGIEQFVEANEYFPTALISGLCSMARFPDASDVSDPRGLMSVFKGDYKGYKGEEIEWVDVRMAQFVPPPNLQDSSPMLWEMNWAMFPLSVCRKGLRFDESYGEHIGHENQQFAWTAHMRHDHRVMIQPKNHAISMPHRNYFPEEWSEQQDHRDANMKKYIGEYGEIEAVKAGLLK